MKKLASILLSVLMLVSMIAGVSAETFTGDDTGIGPITVTLTVEDGKITAADLPKEWKEELLLRAAERAAAEAAQEADSDNAM